MNALLQCAKQGVSTDGATIYVTHFHALIAQNLLFRYGIKQIYYLKTITIINTH